MFDLSWAELIFCAVLALVVVGPKDMPKLLKLVANAMRKARKLYSEFQAGAKQLEKEVDRVSSDGQTQHWQDFLPKDIKRLPDDYYPGQMKADDYQLLKQDYQHEVEKAKAKFAERNTNG